VFLGLGRLKLLVMCALACPALAGAQPVAIEHQDVACIVAGQFPVLDACFRPGPSLARARVYFRPEGPSYIAGSSPRGEQPDPDTLDLEVDRSWFEEVIWPAIAHRVPAFEAIRLLDAWAGHYEVNTLDHNAVIGPHPDLPNFLFANGFSGHGLQQAPAAGRALSEWIATGDYETIDVRALGYDRIARNEPYEELNVI